MSSTNKTSLGLNMWEASDKPVRQDFVNDNVIIDEKITKLNSDFQNQIATTNSNLVKTNLTFTAGNDIELISNNSYDQNGKMYIMLTVKTLINNTANTQRYLGKMSVGPGGTRTVYARTTNNYVLTGWIGADGGIYLYNRTGIDIPSGQSYEVLCVIPK